jgi:hypothetical protein
MQLFKSQFLQEPDRQVHDFAFSQQTFAPRYGRVMSRRSFALSTAMLHGDEEIAGEDPDAHLVLAPCPMPQAA